MTRRARTRSNFYAAGRLERAAHLRANATWLAARLDDPASRVLPVWRSRNLVVGSEPAAGGPRAATLSVAELRELFGTDRPFALLGLVEEVAHFAVDVSHLEAPDDAAPFGGGEASFIDLRAIGPLLPHNEGALLAYARGLMHWHNRHRFCGVCGAPTDVTSAGHERRCANPDCKANHFPRIDPAVIMAIHDGGDRLVLGRQRAWPAGMHSVLAGFVEPGESLEDAVRREVMEEIGIPITDIHYHSSQPWPFPSSIMLGFTARAEADALRVNRDELEDARWYTRAELLTSPEDETFRLPRRDSIARRLVDDWLAGEIGRGYNEVGLVGH